jgi:hypothetical protein
METDFFRSQFGNYADLPSWRHRRFGRGIDLIYDIGLFLNASYRELAKAEIKKQKILIIGVEVPARRDDLKQVLQTLAESSHDVTTRAAVMYDGGGKFHNINVALQTLDVSEYDWLIVVDDDVALPKHFLDRFLYLAEMADLKICMPAHRFHSYQSYAITQRQLSSLVRVTNYVESGPITAFRRDVFEYVLPFPGLRWAWGTDVAWTEYAKRHQFKIGIVDATAIGHLRPVAGSYKSKDAREEGEAFLLGIGADSTRREVLSNKAVYRKNPTGKQK